MLENQFYLTTIFKKNFILENFPSPHPPLDNFERLLTKPYHTAMLNAFNCVA